MVDTSRKSNTQSPYSCRWFYFLLIGLSLPSSLLSQVDLSVERESNDVVLSWNDGGVLQTSTSLTDWETMLNSPSPLSLPLANLLNRQFFRVTSIWGTRSDLLEANSEMSVAELNGKIYVLGGYPSSRNSVTTVQIYDSATDTWSLGTPLPQALNHSMAASSGGKIFLIGGQPSAGGGGPFVNTVYEYDPATTAWTSKNPMPTARSGGAVAVINGLIYVAGGRPPRGNDFAVYNPAEDEWTTLPDMPTQRNHLAVDGIGEKVYVAGGRFGSGFSSELTNILEVYDTISNSWTTQAPMPTIRSGCNGITANGCFYVFGGEGNVDDEEGLFEEVEVYHPGTDSWTQLEPFPIPIHGVTGAAFIDGLIYLPGGGVSQGGSSGGTQHQVFRVALECP